MRLALTCCVFLLLALSALAANWSTVPLEKWTLGQSYDGGNEAAPPYGMPSGVLPAKTDWTEADGVLTGKTNADRWSTILQPGNQGNVISLRFTIQSSTGAKRQLPGGCYRWGFYWGENLPGWDLGVVTHFTDPLHFYRIQISATRGELALWDSTGGFLQIVPIPVKVGETHTLDITSFGAKEEYFNVKIDGKEVLSYWDRTLPNKSGRLGLAVWHSTARIEDFSVHSVDVDQAGMPPHKPAFRVDTADGYPVIYDGNEPISFFNVGRDKTLQQDGIKLRPGWRPQYYNAIGPVVYGEQYAWPPFKGQFPQDFRLVNQSPDGLEFSFAMGTDDTVVTQHTLAIEYDAKRGAYVYSFDSTSTFNKDILVHQMEYIDPLMYNNRVPGPEVAYKWNPAGCQWHVMEGQDGAWQRYPMLDYLTANNNPLKWGTARTFLYPDPAICPAFEVSLNYPQPKDRYFNAGMCLWGYDYHHVEVGGSAIVPKGTVRRYQTRLTGYPLAEADALYKASALVPPLRTKQPDSAIFDPRGTTFNKTTNSAEYKNTMVWDGQIDTTTGHTDKASCRIDGPGNAGVFMYQYVIEQHAKRWWVRGWTKSQGVKGRGLQLTVKYAYAKEPANVYYLGGLGDRDWTYFSFITTAPVARDCTNLLFEVDGPGKVWLDDVAISALKEGENPKLSDFPLPNGLEARSDVLIDLTMADAPTKAVYDESRNGHALFLTGPTYVTEEGRSFLRFDGLKNTATLPLKSSLEPRDLPADVPAIGGESYKPIFRLNTYTYECWVRPQPPATKDIGRMVVFHFRFNPVLCFDELTAKPGECRLSYQNNIYGGAKVLLQKTVPYGKWLHVVATHGDGVVTLYVNGEKAGEAPYDNAKPYFAFFAYKWEYHFGSFLANHSWYTGDLGPFRLTPRALTADEVSERYQNGWKPKQ
ncbi:MAG: LamG-like jellyroll fold domain-containing protein [Armatimonadota bacterium]